MHHYNKQRPLPGGEQAFERSVKLFTEWCFDLSGLQKKKKRPMRESDRARRSHGRAPGSCQLLYTKQNATNQSLSFPVFSLKLLEQRSLFPATEGLWAELSARLHTKPQKRFGEADNATTQRQRLTFTAPRCTVLAGCSMQTCTQHACKCAEEKKGQRRKAAPG